MSEYKPSWDLSTIPDDVWASERGRRNRARQPQTQAMKLKACKGCGLALGAVERRRPCPNCGAVNTRRDKAGNWVDSES